MTDKEKANIKYRLSDIGKQVGDLALEYIAELEKEIEQLKAYESHWDEIEEDAKIIAEENAELKKDKEWLDNTNNEQTEVILKLNEQIEKMKNFYNCSHSSRALCPNEHKCNGCKDWELAE